MPRGGGGFGGGGRGGGFGGGGFRGGGFRGGSSSFRFGNVRSSGRPFGRTGAHRTVSRSPRGNSYGRRYGGRYGRGWGWGWGGWWGYRPWYRRYYWFWGYPYRPWFYSPVYIGSGVILLILGLLIIIPIVGIATIPYPGSSSNSNGVVTYRDTETLYYNEYWYEKENIPSGSTIDYSMQAQGPVTFVIWNQPFENFPKTGTRTGNYTDTITIQGNDDYQYLGYFLSPNDVINFNFQVVSGGSIEFFIADGNNLNKWNNWENIPYINHYTGSDQYSGTFTAPYAQDWYLVWYNSGSTAIQVNTDVHYTVAQIDFSQANVLKADTDLVSASTYDVPSGGDWYFFVYFDPFTNPAQSVDITFDVSFHTGVTYNDQWKSATPILIFIGLIIVLIIIVAIYQRKQAQKPETTTTTTPGQTESPQQTASTPSGSVSTGQTETISPHQTSTAGTCHRCGTSYKPGDSYCNNCGAKLVGRDYGLSTSSTPVGSTNCTYCGFKINADDLFCKNCGQKIEH